MKIGLLTFLFVLWVVALPIVLLGIGFSGGEILSLRNFYRDLLDGDPYIFNRLIAWGEVLLPVAVLLKLASGLLKRLRKRRVGTER
jgi:hypothetical protein